MISAVVLTKNEEKNIKECLEGLKFCDEIIVVDDYSGDGTAKIAREMGAKVYKRHLAGDFAGQRNFGLEKARGEWVLFVDSDERVTSPLRDEIIRATGNAQRSGFYLKRRDFMWGRELQHGEMANVRLLRLARRGAGRWKRAVHEVWEVEGKIGMLKNPILHFPHQSLREFIADVDRMSTLHALANQKEGKKSGLLKIVFWPLGHFINNWIFRLGFLDGTAGFVVAALMSFHSFLAWSKLWLIQKS